jgi:hypothetical protein
LFNSMYLSSSGDDLCPNLTFIGFGYHSREYFPRSPFFAIAQSRFQSTSSELYRLLSRGRDEGYDEACLNKNEAYIFQDNPMLM